MALFKRNKTWWCDFTEDSERYRESLKTRNWQEALKREKARIAEVQKGIGLANDKHLSKGTFNEAAERYLASRKLDLAPRSQAKERESLTGPRRAFGSVQLKKLKPDTLRGYLLARKEAGISNTTLNMERGAVIRVLKHHKRHHAFMGELKPLKVESCGIGRALTHEEQVQLLNTALDRPESKKLRCAVVLGLNTTMRSAELKHLQWQDVDLLQRVVTVRRSKTEAGKREIWLNDSAFAACIELLEQARRQGHDLSEHYLFPACENGIVDPLRPQKTWRTAWRTLTRSVTCPQCGKVQRLTESCRNRECKAEMRGLKNPLAGLRFHDLRHSSITMLAEGDASEQTIRSIAGHLSQKMLEHYSHIRKDAKKRALAALGQQTPKTEGLGLAMAQITSQKLLEAGEGNPN